MPDLRGTHNGGKKRRMRFYGLHVTPWMGVWIRWATSCFSFNPHLQDDGLRAYLWLWLHYNIPRAFVCTLCECYWRVWRPTRQQTKFIFCMIHPILSDMRPSSIAERALARDKGCIFTGVSTTSTSNSDTLVATWISPFLGYTVSHK